ncbi:MAG: hypothetical protein LCH63_21465 [Candidatus Melainabacteria bacterium]|nr:hypothetical protein [Candidatus Melainabacteria bacterium]
MGWQKNLNRAIFVGVILFGSICNALCNEGGLQKDWSPAIYESHAELIFVGSFDGLETDARASDAPTCARFKAIEYLKGPELAKQHIPIRYDLSPIAKSGSAVGGQSELPAKGTVFILFIEKLTPQKGMFETFGGAAGRVKYSEDNYDKIMAVISPFRKKGRYPVTAGVNDEHMDPAVNSGDSR